MITIRPYDKKDFRYVQDICFSTSWLKDKPTATNRAIISTMYCDYYLENEPEFCLVAVDDDVPVGYILCSVDLDNYHEQMMENYLPMVRKLSSSDYYNFAAEVKSEQRYIKQGYTAHIHMDVLEECAEQGIDTQLLDAMQKKLAEMYVEGLFVVCGMKDEILRAYYEDNGFDDIDYFGGSVVYGKKLFVED